MLKDLLVAHRYAAALFELARELFQDEAFEAELDSFSAALKSSPDLEKFLANPSVKTEEKRRFLERIYQPHHHVSYPVLLNFFTTLLEKGRFYLIHEITQHFKKLADELQGQGTAEIRSASALEPEAQARIVQRLEKIAGYKITVKNVVDPSLIGGVVVHVRNKVIDDSVSSKIRMMKKELTKIQSI